MKKTLFKLVSLFIVPATMFAQDPIVDTTYDAAWFDMLNEHFVVKYDNTNEVQGLKGLIADHCSWRAYSSESATNKITVEANFLKITHKRLTSADNYTDINLEFVDWFGQTTIKFGPGADTVGGQFVNMAEDVIVTMDVQTDVSCELSVYLMDINGHVSNSQFIQKSVIAGGKQAIVFDFDEQLWDWYGGDFWGFSNGRYSTSSLVVGGYTKTYEAQDFIPFDASKIAKIAISVNPFILGTVDQEINLEVSNIVVGNVDEAVDFVNAENLPFNSDNVYKAYYSYNGILVQPSDSTVITNPSVPTDTVNVIEELQTSTYDAAWFDTLNNHYVVYYDKTNEVKGLKGLTADGDLWKASSSSAATNEVSVENNILKVTHKRLTINDNWTEISAQFVDWFGGSGIKFGSGADTVGGQFVNMKDDVRVSMNINTDVECEVHMFLMDVNGHFSQSDSRTHIVTADIEKGYQFEFDEVLWDWYGGEFWGVSNGRYSPSELIVGEYTKTYMPDHYIPFDASKVVKVILCINTGKRGTIDQEINLEVSNIVVGDVDEAVDFVPAYDLPLVKANVEKAYYTYAGNESPESPEKPEIDSALIRLIDEYFAENTSVPVMQVVKDPVSDSAYLTLAEDMLEQLLGVDLETIVSDSLVIWYYDASSGLKADADWKIYGYGPQVPVSEDGIYQARFYSPSGDIIGVSAVYEIGASVDVADSESFAFVVSGHTVSANVSGSIAVFAFDGSLIATSESNSVVIPSQFSGITVVYFISDQGTLFTDKFFIQ